MRKVIVIILVFLSLVSLVIRFGAKPLGQVLGARDRAGIRIEASKKSKVFINDKELGTTPYQDEGLASGSYLISLKSPDEGTSSAKIFWQGYAKLNSGTLTVVNRDIADLQNGSSGEIISLEKGDGVTIVSTPTEAEVIIDGKSRGRTPLAVNDLTPGEHQFIVSRDNYLKRSIRATVVEGFNLVLTIELAIAEADLTKLPTVPSLVTNIVIVKATPTGFLRVRKTATINGEEVTKVNPGDELTLLEEIPNWNRVRTKDGKEGYVSSLYTQKKPQ